MITSTMLRHGTAFLIGGLLIFRLFRASSETDSLTVRRLPSERAMAMPKWKGNHPQVKPQTKKKHRPKTQQHPKFDHDPWEPDPWYDHDPWEPCIPPETIDSKEARGRHHRKGNLKNYNEKELKFEGHEWGVSKEWIKHEQKYKWWWQEYGKKPKHKKSKKSSKSMKGRKSSKSKGHNPYNPRYKEYKKKRKPKPCPTKEPTKEPTVPPSLLPSETPSVSPSLVPTEFPTDSPTLFPSVSPTVAPTDSPTLSPTNAPTMEPLSGSRDDFEPFSFFEDPPKTTGAGDYVVEITPFAILFKVANADQPTENDLDDVERLTARLLGDYFEYVFSDERAADLNSVDVAVRRDDPPQVQSSMIEVFFEVEVVFDDESDAVPTTGQMDILVQEAFWGKTLDRYQKELESLPRSSLFVSALVYSVSTDSGQRSSEEYATRSSSSSSLAPPAMVVAIVSFTTFVMGAFFFVLYRQKAMKEKRQSLFPNEVPRGKDDGQSVADATVAMEDEDSLVECGPGGTVFRLTMNCMG